MLLSTARKLSFQPPKLAMLFENVRWTWVSGNVESLNYISN